MNIDNNKIKENFIDKLPFRTSEVKDEFQARYKLEIEKFVGELCDLSKVCVNNLSEQDTYIFRKRLGVFDAGKIQTCDLIAYEISKSRELVRQKIIKYYKIFIKSVREASYAVADDRTRMSSLSINGGFNNYPIAKLRFSTRIRNILLSRVNTLYELLSYGLKEIKDMGLSEANYIIVVDKIHSLGLKFIDELSLEERLSVISNSPSCVIDNSSLSWINAINTLISVHSKKIYKFTIGMLKYYYLSGGYVNNQAKEYALSVGINLDLVSGDLQDYEKCGSSLIFNDVCFACNNLSSFDDLLNKSVIDIDFPVSLYYIFEREGIRNVRDIVSHNSYDFIKMEGIGGRLEKFLVDYIHELGLVFADELPLMKNYVDGIVLQMIDFSEDALGREAKFLQLFDDLTHFKGIAESCDASFECQNTGDEKIKGLAKVY